MLVVPNAVGRASRAWDEQHLEVSAAARQLGSVETGGFTVPVAGSAARFAATWQRHTDELAGRAEAFADGLRAALADYRATDRAVGDDQLALQAWLVEER